MNLVPVMWDWDTDDRRFSTTSNPNPNDLQGIFIFWKSSIYF